MTGLYPKIEPYGHGMLDVGDGCQLQANRTLNHFRGRFLQLKRRLNVVFAANH